MLLADGGQHFAAEGKAYDQTRSQALQAKGIRSHHQLSTSCASLLYTPARLLNNTPMTPEHFVEKWKNAKLSERAASHEHFIDLCHMLGIETPAQSDPDGVDYCCDKAVQVIAPASKGAKGDSGFVDVWKRGCFAWEYKREGRYKDLTSSASCSPRLLDRISLRCARDTSDQ